MWNTFPLFGGALLLCVMLAASYTFAISLYAGSTGKARALQAARFGAYGTVAFTAVAVFALAYAFLSHDFRLRYVAHYSDRSMSVGYLLTALWGGQDGSLLWWLFLLSLYIGACVKWLGKRYVELQPWIIATLMGIVIFFCVLMTYSANPFATSIGGARADGEGLNPLLQNFYMIIHPPSLYTGFVGCSIPFAFAVAALITGRLDAEWIVACRKWTLFAWLFLAIGNTLGMLWAYEELGWGGYWAWDPVENAAFMPFITASAFVHSVMIQERRGLLKVWNIALVCVTFFMTIFGTFLTRSGAIASVHSFAQSSIGTYFVWFLVIAFVFCFTLILYRWPELRNLVTDKKEDVKKLRIAAVATGWTMFLACLPGNYALSKLGLPNTAQILVDCVVCGAAVYVGIEVVYRRLTQGVDYSSDRPQLESVFSREFTFLLNNWALLGFLLFVLVATTFPMLSEAISGDKVTVGPPYYNVWVQPLGLVIFALMGIGTLFGWKKTSPDALKRAFIAPTTAMVIAALLQVTFGKAVGFPAVVWGDAIYGGAMGVVLRGFNAYTPIIGFSLCVFNAAIIIQEFAFLFRSRRRTGAAKEGSWLWPIGFVASVIAVLGLVLMRKSFPSPTTFGFTVIAVSLVALVAPYFIYTLVSLPHASRRRYGGFIVHFGLVFMFLGFTGKSWTVDRETSMTPHEHYQVAGYDIEYLGPRMELDVTKRMVFGDVAVTRDGVKLGVATPAKFMYKKMPDSPTTEVSMIHTLRDDLYLVVGSINPQTKVASFQIHINPLVSWIWFGAIILIFGSIISMWPELQPAESRVWAFARGAAGATAAFTLGIIIAAMPAPAWAQQAGTSSMHAGTVHIENPREHALFNSLRCMCGTCPRDLLSTCSCSDAEDAREALRKKIAEGETNDQIILEYAQQYGSEALSIPPNRGGMRAIYAVPLVAFGAGGAGVIVLIRRWKGQKGDKKSSTKGGTEAKRDDYDDRLDEELRDLDE